MRPNWKTITDENLSTHIRFDGVRGVSFVGNTMSAGRDDNDKGVFSPECAMVLKDCAYTVIKDNTMYDGALKELIRDLGEHGEGFVLKDNVGSILELPPPKPVEKI